MIDDPDLLRFLQTEETRATDTTLNNERKTALEFYRGDLFGDEIDGRSKLRTRDVAEVIDYMCESVLRTMVSGDKFVEFEPVEPIMAPDEQQAPQPGQPPQQQKDISQDLAQEATERVHWNFLREQDGLTILHDGIKAGLLEKSGVWKSWVERPLVRQDTRMNAVEVEQAGKSVAKAEPVSEMYDIHEETGEPLQVYDVTLMVPGPPKFVDAAVPNEEFFVAPDARTLNSAIYLGNISRVSLAQLIEMGYEEEDVENLWGDNTDGQELRDARDDGRTEREGNTVRSDLSRQVILREEYARCVYDGVYQLVRVHRVNTTVLSCEPVEGQPYTLWCPFPMQHRLIGQSLADKTMDIQVARSHILRQYMDAQNLSLAPRMYLNMQKADETTIDDCLDVAPGGLVRGNGDNAVTPLVQPFTGGPALQALEFMAGEKESRTGITRLNQGIDADALNKTATGTALMQASGQQIEEYVARNAGNAIGKLFEKKLKLMIAEMQPHQFKIDGTPKVIDPAQWPKDMRVNVRVGLGSGSKERQLQKIQMLIEAQGAAVQLDPRLVGPEQAFNTGKLMVQTLGFGLATQYFADPANFGQEPPKPDPEMAKAQAQIQQAQDKLRLDQQTSGARLMLQQAADQAKLQTLQQQGAQKAHLDALKAQFDAEMAQARAVEESRLAEQQMQIDALLKVHEIQADTAVKHRAAQYSASVQKFRQGGSLAK